MNIPGTSDQWRPWLAERAGELRTAIVFLTRIPFAHAAPAPTPAETAAATHGAVAQAGWAFPLAGVIVGVIGAVVYALAHGLGLPPWPAAALAVAATMAASGALHEDGLADTLDGFGGGETRERKLDIMRDARIGTYGVCALVVSILIRVAAVASLADAGLAAAALVAAHAAARATLPALMTLVPPARRDGLSFAAGQPAAVSAAVAALIGFVVLVLCLGFGHAIVALIALVIATFLIALLSLRQIDGQTGDVLGAVEQVGEIVVLLVAAV
jgi:adenosylcobinamide-GDP ribazoletransferase